MIFQPDPFD